MNRNFFSIINHLSITAIMIIALGCGSKDLPVNIPLPESSPITAGQGTEQQTVRLGQSLIQIEMNHNEMETIFGTRDVPSTCTRIVQRGTHPECHMENRQQCSTRYEQECRNVSFPVCSIESQNVCRDVPDQVCHTQQVPVCQNIPRQVCESVDKCETVNDQVCNSHGCTTVPRRVCHAVQSCHTQNDQVCHTETRQQCDQITRRECHIENHQQCHNENRQECTNVPRQHCENIPQQACVDVPTQVQEQYSCMQPQQVPVGERLKLHQLVQLRIDLVNPRHLDVSRDELVVTLNQGMISGIVKSAIGIQYQIREASRAVRQISSTEEIISVSLEVTALY